jgi:3'-phosphoadenosine 5'-phosphosulfate (PAPS) 3'-phosphatase
MSAPTAPPDELHDLLDLAVEIARLAGQSTPVRFQSGVRVETKAGRSPVTIADRAAERILPPHMERQFPRQRLRTSRIQRPGGRHEPDQPCPRPAGPRRSRKENRHAQAG